jgi:hypothetical protein
MKKLMTCLTAGLLVLGAQSVLAQSTNTPATSDTPAAAHKEMTPEQRKARQEALKLLGLSPKDLKDLSHKERADKIKEAADTYFAAFKAKKADGTATEQDKTDAEIVHKFIASLQHKKAKATADNQ